ncbi:PaaI family thioesterase [Noviherbaspirillum pedocola]|uniref:PaaI family thioesterase n=1 Tax=Noviherbaspirillum pedocola TaxID=2801341 RepID=A0A934W2I5_9BURK|nr:PaaI family thioesterase [Noviherbaspirillum pedocola]MBK4736361.1 PaaI family thioesterase [Noviherbaspirillum pedocola]
MPASHATPAAFPDVPDGFEPLQRGGPWFGQLGPVYARPAGETAIIIGLRLDERHLNVRGVAHGGMLMTLADSALGIAVHQAVALKGLATVSMSCDFLEPAGPGAWMEAHVELGRIGARMAFASCHLVVNGRRILRASGVFALMRK